MKPKEVRFHEFHYRLDDKSGFWISQNPGDKYSATITETELLVLGEDYVTQWEMRLARASEKLEFFKKELSKFE
jgi:hypothetical protein